MKLAVIKDPHFRYGFDSPRGRTEDFFSQIDNKLEQLYQLKQQHNLEGLILTGDILDKSSGYTLPQVRANLDKFHELQQRFGKVYSILGNHDVKFASSVFKSESLYQILVNHNIIHDITEYPTQIGNYTLAGLDYANKDITYESLLALDARHTNLIAVLHTHLVPDSYTMQFGDFHTYSQITKALKNTKMIIAGHLHRGYPIAQVNGVTIINQWSFTRLARDYYTVSNEHTPQVAIIDTDDLHNPTTLNLVCSDYDSAFIQKELERESSLQANLHTFVESCKAVEIRGDSTIGNAPEAIRQRVEYYLNKAEEANVS